MASTTTGGHKYHQSRSRFRLHHTLIVEGEEEEEEEEEEEVSVWAKSAQLKFKACPKSHDKTIQQVSQ